MQRHPIFADRSRLRPREFRLPHSRASDPRQPVLRVLGLETFFAILSNTVYEQSSGISVARRQKHTDCELRAAEGLPKSKILCCSHCTLVKGRLLEDSSVQAFEGAWKILHLTFSVGRKFFSKERGKIGKF